MSSIDRRQHERFAVNPSVTPILVRTLDETEFRRTGHAYDISEGGVRFELDIPIDPGTPIAMQIDVPAPPHQEIVGPGRAVFVLANVIWADEDEPGACVMAAAITRFCRAGDKDRLLRRLTANRFLRAA